MGSNCSSCESTDVATAKVILQDGRLQEFACPIKVSQVLERNPNCFICNSDDMDFNDQIVVGGGEGGVMITGGSRGVGGGGRGKRHGGRGGGRGSLTTKLNVILEEQ